MSNLPTVLEVRKRIERISDPDIKYGYMYLFLIAGDTSEAFGENCPKGNDAELVSYNFDDIDYEAVLFQSNVPRVNVKRAVAIPLDPYYEPWAEPLYEYFMDHKNEYLFGNDKEGIKPITIKRYAMDKAFKIFVGFPCYKNEKRIPFNTLCLKDVRIKSLREFYMFQDLHLSLFTLIQKYVEQNKPNKDIVKKIVSKENTINELKHYAEEYFHLLLKPFKKLSDESYDPVLESIRYDNIVKRHNKALEICNYIAGTNYLSENKLGNAFLNENMRFVLRLFKKCTSDNDFMASLSALAVLFETSMAELKKELDINEKSINIINYYLDEKNIQYNHEMIETWKKIVKLRNMEPLHYNIDGKILGELYEYFGEELRYPQNYEVLWNKVLEKFYDSLIMWNNVLNNL